MKQITGLAIVGLALTALNCASFNATTCGGRATAKKVSFFALNHSLEYKSTECALEAKQRDAKITFKQPDTSAQQVVNIIIAQHNPMEGMYEMVVLNNGFVVGRDKSGKPFKAESHGTYHTVMTSLIPNTITLPIDVIVFSGTKKILHYVIAPK